MDSMVTDFFGLMNRLCREKEPSQVVDSFIEGMNDLLKDVALYSPSEWDDHQRDGEVISIADQSFGQIGVLSGWADCSKETKSFVKNATSVLSAVMYGISTAAPIGMNLLEYNDHAFDRVLSEAEADASADQALDVELKVVCGMHSEDSMPWIKNGEIGRSLRTLAVTGNPLRTTWIDHVDGQMYRAYDIRAFRIPGNAILVVFLEVSFEQMRQVYNTILGNVWVVDANFRIVDANQSVAEMLGMPLQRLIGNTCCDVLKCEHRNTEKCTLQRVLQGQVIRGHGVILNDALGNDIVCSVSAWPYKDSAGRIIGALVGFKDITEKKRLEAIAATVDTSNNLAYAIAGIRHEIGNPINSMKMALSVLKTNLHQYSRAYIGEYLDRLLGEVQRVEYLLTTLKSFNMYERPRIKDCDIHRVIDEIDALAFEEFQSRGCHVFRNYAPEARWVKLDPRAMHQIMLNLMSNAMDAMEKVEDPLIEIDVQLGKNVVLLRIKDNGCGMTQQQLDDLFKPFFTTKPSGTGLGMVLVEQMLAQMGCSIQVYSQVDLGTEVVITIPEGRAQDVA